MPLKEDKNKIQSGLYIVSTPIGNLRDITLRAIDVLNQSDLILCEDTRVTKKLISNYKINTKITPYHKFNERKNLDKIINFLKDGQIISLVSDAGTPTVSDPGNILVKQCIKEKISIIPIPGPSAVITSMSVSGFSNCFYFHGFLSDTENLIRKEFKLFQNFNCSIVFFISVQKLTKRFELLREFFADREILICRELTKLHESFYRGKISELNINKFVTKGEATVVISEEKQNNEKYLNESDKKTIRKLISYKSVKDIVRIFSQEKNISKSKIYNYCLQIKNEK